MSKASKRIVVSGSWAYDYLMDFDGLFKNEILPSKIDHLSVAFTAAQKTLHFGGCAGNIAYTLKLLGGDPLVLGLVGKDFDEYEQWLQKCGIDSSTLTKINDTFTASAYILTDREANQIVFFHGGAMLAAPDDVNLKKIVDGLGVQEGDENLEMLVIISPDDPRRMIRLAQQCMELGVPYVFDPSQQITNIDKDALKKAVRGAWALMTNEYEADLMASKFGVSVDELAAMVPVFVETLGEKGVKIVYAGAEILVPAVKPLKAVNPTGCGDAFRAGFLFGLTEGLDENSESSDVKTFDDAEKMSSILKRAAQIGVLAATYNLEHAGTQEHSFSQEDFQKRFEESFCTAL